MSPAPMDHPNPSSPPADPRPADGVARTMFYVCLVAGLSFVIVIFTKIL
jgi:hypothetical protein